MKILISIIFVTFFILSNGFDISNPHKNTYDIVLDKTILIPHDNVSIVCRKFDINWTHMGTKITQFMARVDIDNKLFIKRMKLHVCDEDPNPDDVWDCRKTLPRNCRNTIWTWGFGGYEELLLPENVGFLIGEKSKYFVFETVYTRFNDTLERLDSTSLYMNSFKTTFNNAGIFKVGYRDRNHDFDMISSYNPAYKSYVASCSSFCTNQKLQNEGISIIGYQPNMEIGGQQMSAIIIHEDNSTEVLFNITKFEPKSQSYTPFSSPIELHKGDNIIVECKYLDEGNKNSFDKPHKESCVVYFTYIKEITDFKACLNYTSEEYDETIDLCGVKEFKDKRQLPYCDIDLLDKQLLRFESNVTKNCQNEKSCSKTCKQSLLAWANDESCTRRFKLKGILDRCDSLNSKICDKLENLISICDVCDFDDDCNVGHVCESFVCKRNRGGISIFLFILLIILYASALPILIFLIRRRLRKNYNKILN